MTELIYRPTGESPEYAHPVGTIDEAVIALEALRNFISALPAGELSVLDPIAEAIEEVDGAMTGYISRSEAAATAQPAQSIDEEIVTTPIPSPSILANLGRPVENISDHSGDSEAVQAEIEQCPYDIDMVRERATEALSTEPLMTQNLVSYITGRVGRSEYFSSIKRILDDLVASGELVCSQRNHPRWWGVPGKDQSYYACFEAQISSETTEPCSVDRVTRPVVDGVAETLAFIKRMDARSRRPARRRARR